MPIRRLEDTFTGTSATIGADELTSTALASVEHVKPHIQPGKLYPAVAGKLLDGTTSHGATYGVAQGDGRSYYYTDIKGSKPIKDPRIGAHFGSQRHKFKSKQLLEQETATHGTDVYSIDGREWVRAVHDSSGTMPFENDSNGQRAIQFNTSTAGSYFEATGYFSDVNILVWTRNDFQNDMDVYVDGTKVVDGSTTIGGRTTAASPLAGRYVDASSLVNTGVNQTLGIHTIKFLCVGTAYFVPFGIELIAQDTTSTATKSQIQIPSQNVVSYGKKFTVSGTPHYNPFATKGDGSASTIPNNTTGDSVATGWTGATSAYWDSSLDTATSLGLGAWESGGNYYRPVNGGRVVKWVDSSGNIKTSVNMMPPEADSIAEDTGTCDATGTHNWSTQYLPQFGNKTVGSAVTEDDMADNSTSGWTVSGGSLTFDTDHYEQTSSGTDQFYISSDAPVLTSGRLYRISVDVKNGTASGVSYKIRTWTASAGGGVDNGPVFTTTGAFVTHTFVIEGGTQRRYGFQPQTSLGGNNIEFKNFAVYEIEDPFSQAEVAKTFHWREFGNGSANGGTGATYADASMVSTAPNINGDEVSYVMDDGLTSFATDHAYQNDTTSPEQDGDGLRIAVHTGVQNTYFTFIGTGFSAELKKWSTVTFDAVGNQTLVQNLPYGTHIVKIARDNSGTDQVTLTVDGVSVQVEAFNVDNNALEVIRNLSFHQPKMPPIPDDAVVLADYMLMADTVHRPDNDGTTTHIKIHKGVRRVSASRDIFYNGSTTINYGQHLSYGIAHGHRVYQANSDASKLIKLPYFGTGVTFSGQLDSNYHTNALFKINGTAVTTSSSGTNHSGTQVLYQHTNGTDSLSSDNNGTFTMQGSGEGYAGVTGINLGTNEVEVTADATSNYYLITFGFDVATPIHTSSHYQTFETPFLHELVGGDRNMEQTNLVVTPDGKTWDEVTRDTSYISPSMCLTSSVELGSNVTTNPHHPILDTWRGQTVGIQNKMNAFQKNFAIAYDRVICLVPGTYKTSCSWYHHSGAIRLYVVRNQTTAGGIYSRSATGDQTVIIEHVWDLQRGDYLHITIEDAGTKDQDGRNLFIIEKVS